MSNTAYAVVFHGEILDGFEHNQVRYEFARLFGLDTDRLEQIFTQGRVILKRGLSREEADHYIAKLGEIGALARLEPPHGVTPPAQDTSATAHAAPAASAVPASRPSAAPATSVASVALPSSAPHAAAAPAAMSDSKEERRLPFEFTGTGGEFFRIWIVNRLLSIVTLGIYSAWAKVRTNRYFYGNTRLDGNSFEYLADPVKILKGRLIAFALFATAIVAEKINPILSIAFSLLLFFAVPWIVVRGLNFRNQNVAWRGVRFGFDGRVGEAVKVFALWPLAGVLTLGLLLPLAMRHQQRFMIENSRYGASHFEFSASVKQFYLLYGVCFLIAIAGFVTMSIAGTIHPVLSSLAIALTYFAVFAYFKTTYTNLIYRHTMLADHRLDADYRIGSYLALVVVNGLLIVLTLGFFAPWAKVRTARYAAEHICLHATDSLDNFVAEQRDAVSAAGGEIGELFDVDIGL